MSAEVSDDALVDQLVQCLMDRETEESVRAAAWLEENEASDAVWGMIGRLLDEIEQAAAER